MEAAAVDLSSETRSQMSPRPHAQGTSWRLIVSFASLWLLAAIVLAVLASPATTVQASSPRHAVQPAATASRVQATGHPEAPLVTLILVAGVAGAYGIRRLAPRIPRPHLATRLQPAPRLVRIREGSVRLR